MYGSRVSSKKQIIFMGERIKNFLKDNQKDVILFAGVALISLSSFALGRLTAPRIPKTPIQFREIDARAQFFGTSTQRVGESPDTNGNTQLVASKNGKYYYYPWCPGADRLSEKNKIIFSSAEEAKAKGYAPSSNCPGLQ